VVDVLAATEAVIPAIEIVDSRVKDWKIKIRDTIADNASSARLVLGSRFTDPRDCDLRLVGMVLEKNGEVVSTGGGPPSWDIRPRRWPGWPTSSVNSV
jgi:2-keto-4-pentenoate hydratase